MSPGTWASSLRRCANTSCRSKRTRAGAKTDRVDRARPRKARWHSTPAAQYTSIDYTQTLDDHGVLTSIGSVGDPYDNARAESFVDSFKTELIADGVWASRSQLELAVVEYIASTTSACTKLSATAHPERSRNSTLSKTGQPGPSNERWEPTKKWSPWNPGRLTHKLGLERECRPESPRMPVRRNTIVGISDGAVRLSVSDM